MALEQVHTFKGKIVRKSDAAWLAKLDGFLEPVWLPFSEVDYCEQTREFTVPHWLAVKKELF